MKKIIITLAIAVSSLAVFAGEGNVSAEVLKAFNKEFTTAQDVKWATTTNYYKATFIFTDQHVSAFYSFDGELLRITRNISSLDLPVKLQAKLKKNFSSYWISDLVEISNNDGTHYYITLENADTKMIMQSNGDASWNGFKKIEKV